MHKHPMLLAFPVCLLALIVGCKDTKRSVAADIVLDFRSVDGSVQTGTIYVGKDRLRVDWGVFADVFDLNKRRGWRIIPQTKTYSDLFNKDLSTFAPEMTNGSLCPHATVPSRCKLSGVEQTDGRTVKRWALWDPRGYYVYYWTDEKLGITVRCKIGRATYEVKNLRDMIVPHEMFELPAGYKWEARPELRDRGEGVFKASL